jgi:hypothetical protein
LVTRTVRTVFGVSDVGEYSACPGCEAIDCVSKRGDGKGQKSVRSERRRKIATHPEALTTLPINVSIKIVIE